MLKFSIAELIAVCVVMVPTMYVMITGAPFVPTQMAQVRRMLKAADIKKGDRLYDIGAGDGRLVHHAKTEYGADSIGYEYSPLVWTWSKILNLFWRSGAKLRYGNMWKQDFSDADFIVCYLLPKAMNRFKKEIWPTLKPGCKIISHAFSVPDLKPDKKLPRNRDQKLGPVLIYRKTAKN
jgi:hypothetical protein